MRSSRARRDHGCGQSMNSRRQSASTWGTMQRTRKPRGRPARPAASRSHPTLRMDAQAAGRWPAASARIRRNRAGTRHAITSGPARAGRARTAGRGRRRRTVGRSGNFWQVLAIVALVAATAGWTTVGGPRPPPRPVRRGRGPDRESFDPEATDDTEVPPVADTHDALELESLLPATLTETALQAQSWDGDGAADRRPVEHVDDGVPDRRLQGPGRPPRRPVVRPEPGHRCAASSSTTWTASSATALRDALIAAWKGDYPEMKVSQVTLGGKDVTKGDFGEDTDHQLPLHPRRRRLRHRVVRRGDRDRGPGRAARARRVAPRRSPPARRPRPRRACPRPDRRRRSRRASAS